MRVHNPTLMYTPAGKRRSGDANSWGAGFSRDANSGASRIAAQVAAAEAGPYVRFMGVWAMKII